MGVPFVKDQRVLKCTGLFVSQRLKAKNYQVQKIIQKSSTTSEIVLQLFVEMRKLFKYFFFWKIQASIFYNSLCSLTMTMMQMMKYFIRGKGSSTLVDHTPCEQKTMGLNPVKCVIFSLSILSVMCL